ncbi:biotin synthase BioB [Arthrobacter psychrochitiniphilus]|uniref:Biotin synthase n=1 Tax=Arthrobacter psychrochitiniphilus TaxID=291045 RepID=A0A2V3DNV3_9MICC|nr:biotin synthase BioB [Arthrobacter psychrochitiniphilus]NYG16169.1 biotin synthase [Arthrobacter psychrochitiniphilus]PXA64447.1 biotin synthase BioB [Arthrobacter psychrochitiniphilus]
MFNYFDDLATRQLSGATLTRHEALAILESTDEQLLEVVAAAARLRRTHFSNTVKVNYLVNLKSGLCPEDCTYCSQRLGSAAQILKYTWLKPEDAVAQAATGIRAGASRVCMVASGKGPTDRDVDRVAGMVTELKDQHPDVEVCACLGILKEGQAGRLKAAGVDAYNHNLNTSESMYAEICSTHEFSDRVQTVEHAKAAGLSPCSGIIVGMGESHEDLIDAVFALRELGSDSIPVNFLMPFDGTPLEGTWLLRPAACMRVLALVRFACPSTELRMAGGREMHLRTLQPLALHVANSLFLGDYLTSEGQAGQADLAMIADNGFVVLGSPEAATQQGCGSQSSGGCGCHGTHDAETSSGANPTIRRRGAGTQLAPNA